MDISTIKQKLDSRVYTSPEEFKDDMQLMFENCYTYNQPDSVVYTMGKELQRAYESIYAEMPTEVKRKRVDPVVSPIKPKRIARSPEGMNPEEHNNCLEILSELEKQKHRKYSRPFLYPVTEQDAPGYFSIISNPIDLSTIKSKLDTRKYSSAAEFISDLNLMLSNCFVFNKPESDVYKCGEEFDKVLQQLLNKEKDPEARIADIRRKIAVLTQELRALEQQCTKGLYTLSDRERIGKTIIQMTRTQTAKIAEIVHRHCAYEYVDNDEIEINLETMPDDIVKELDEYIMKIKNGEAVSSASE
ncbi:transcription initiation at TATA-containing promoter protein [Glugoides intestinalis]